MLANPLTRQVGLKVGPIVLETLVKHYFERITKDAQQIATRNLRQDELLYDEAFNIIRVWTWLFRDTVRTHLSL
jgi:hypothetical protein